MTGTTCSGNGDPSMMLLNATNQLSTEFLFRTESSNRVQSHYLNLIVATNDISTIFLDGLNLNSLLFTPFVFNTDFSIAKIKITTGNHHLKSDNGLIAYGYGWGSEESYSYSLGGNLVPKTIYNYQICTSSDATLVAPNLIETSFWELSTDTLGLLDTLYLPSPVEAGVYFLNGTNKTSGCKEQISYLVEPSANINTSMHISKDTICSFEEIEVQIEPKNDIYSYKWNLSNENKSAIRLKPSSSMWITCEIFSKNNCSSSKDSIFINVKESNFIALETSADDNKLCAGDTAKLKAKVAKKILFENANGGFTKWKKAIGVVSNTTFGSVAGNSFLFNGSFERVIETVNYNLSNGGKIEFYIRSNDVSGVLDTPDENEEIYLQYSTDDGITWKTYRKFYPFLYKDFTRIAFEIPDSLKVNFIAFRWIQPFFTGSNFDVWALDNIAIGSYTNTGFSALWSPNTSLTSNTSFTPLAFPNSDIPYQLTVTDNETNCTITDTLWINVGNPFTLLSSNDTIICDINGTPLQTIPSISGNFKYVWTPYDRVSNPYISNPNAYTFENTNFIVTATSENGCVTKDTVNVKVTTLIDLSVSASDYEICQGDTIAFNASIKGTFFEDDFDPAHDFGKWTRIEGEENTLCGSASGNALYFNGSTARLAETIDLNMLGGGFVNFKLKIGTLGIPCEKADFGEDVVLEFSTDGVFFQQMALFGVNDYSFFQSVSVPIPLEAQTASTRFRWRQLNWTAKDFDNWAIDDVEIISGGNANDFIVEWSPSDYVEHDTLLNTLAFPITETIFQLKLTDVFKCSVTRDIKIKVGSNFNSFTTPDTLLCSTDGAKLMVKTDNLYQNYYEWTPANFLDDPMLANPTIFPTDTTLFKVKITSDSGCTQYDSVLVFVPKPIFLNIFTNKNGVCIGDSTLLEAQTQDVVIDSFSSNSINSSNWKTIIGGSISENCGSVSGNALYFSGDSLRIAETKNLNTVAGGTISFYIKFGSGTFPCDNPELGEDVVLEYSKNNGINWSTITILKEFNYSNFTLINLAIPTEAQSLQTMFRWKQISFTGNGDNWALDNISIISGTEANYYNYKWTSNPTSYIADSANSFTYVKPTERTRYTILIEDTITGCSVEKDITLKAGSYFNTQSSDDTLKCDTNPILLFVSNDYAGTTKAYWSPSYAISNSNSFTPLVNPTITTKYFVETQSDSGCSVFDTVLITVIPPLQLNVTASDTGVCLGDSVQLYSNAQGGLGTLIYTWNPSLFLSDIETENPISWTIEDILYSVLVEDSSSGCFQTDSIRLKVGPFFNANFSADTLVCSNDSIALLATYDFPGNVTFEWSPAEFMNSNLIANPMVSVEDTTIFYVKVISDSGCTIKDSIIVYKPNNYNIGISQLTPTPVCMGGQVKLIADENISDCNEYEIKNVPFNLIPGSGAPINLGNDNIAFPENIGFDFRFFCNYYSKFYLSSNGFLTFSENQYHGCCAGGLLPSNIQPNNMIAFAWANLSPLLSGTVDFFTTGMSPNRVFVLNLKNISHATGINPITTQIQLYETTNEIQIHTSMMLHDGTPHTMGIENFDGTKFYSPIGRNASLWNATNEGISFKPNYIPPSVIYTWEPSEDVLISGKTAIVTPNRDEFFYVNAYDPISECIFSSSIFLNVDTTFELFTNNDTILCNTLNYPLKVSSSTFGVTYQWEPAHLLNNPTSTAPTIKNETNTQLYTVFGTQGSTGCKSGATVLVEKKILDSLVISADTFLCKGENIRLLVSGGQNYEWFPKTEIFNFFTDNPLIVPSVDRLYSVSSTDSVGCKAFDSVFVRVDSVQRLDFGPDISLCENAFLRLDAGSGYQTYLWQDNSTNRTFSANNVGTYWVNVTNSCGAFSDTISILGILNATNFTLGNDIEFCENDTVFIGVSIPNVSYLWSTGETSDFIIPKFFNQYILQITNNNNCITRDTINVTKNPLPILQTNDTTLCKGIESQLFVSGALFYNWFENPFLTQNNSSTPSVIPLNNQVFYVEGTDSNGCKNIDSVKVIIDSIPTNFLNSTMEICLEKPTQIITNQLFNNYLWSTNDTSNNITVNKEGIYWLKTQNNCGTGIDSISVTYYRFERPKIKEVFYLCSTEIAEIEFENPLGYDSILWKQNDSILIANTSNLFLPKGMYQLEILDNNNCFIHSDFEVKEGIGDLLMPNIFTPNNDNINDFLELIEYSCITNFEITIYNRWGKQLFQSFEPNFKWKGEGIPDGIYYYDIQLTNTSEDEKRVKGWFQIAR